MDNNYFYFKFHFRIYSILVILLWLITPVSDQIIPLNDDELMVSEFGKKSGFELENNIHSMVYDQEGWLWVSGIKSEANNYKLGNSTPQLIRFNGKAFYEVKLPKDILNSAVKVYTYKKDKKNLYVSFVSNDIEQIYNLNTETLVFTKLWSEKFNKNQIIASRLIKWKTHFYYLIQKGDNFTIFEVSEASELKEIGTISAKGSLRETNLIKLNNSFIISNSSIGVQRYDLKNKLLKQYNSGDFLNSKLTNNSNLFFDSAFFNKENIYIRLKSTNDYFKYALSDDTWELLQVDGINNEGIDYKYSFEYFDNLGNLIISKVRSGNTYLYAFEDVESNYIWHKIIPTETANSPVITSRDINQEIIFNANKKLYTHSINKKGVQSYLHDLSIRAMTQINDSSVMIATDFDGWFSLNLISGQISPIAFTLNGKDMSFPSQNRDLYLQDNTIWSNDNRGLLEVDLRTFDSKRHLNSISVSAMHQNDSDIIIGEVNGRLLRFNKNKLKSEVILEKDTINYERIVRKEGIIYSATNYGLAVIKNRSRQLYSPPNKEDQNLIFVGDFENLGILVGTRSGKVLRFDEKAKTFETLYEDKLNASVASIVSYGDYLWINTFAGFVAYNITNKSHIRFGTNDGFSHYESNRHSFAKLNNGNILIGTIKGANVFNPNELLKNYRIDKGQNSLEFVSISYYESDSDSEKKNFDVSTLKESSVIVLPALSNNISFNFSLISNITNQNFNYRYRINDKPWTDIKNTHIINFNNLAAGNYTLDIQAYDPIKGIEIASKSASFKVERIFYRTIWFYVLCFIVIGAILFIILKNKQKAKEASLRSELLKKEVEFKQKDLKNIAANIVKMQQWNEELLDKLKEIKSSSGDSIRKDIKQFESLVRQKKDAFAEEGELQNRVNTLNAEFYEKVLNDFPKLSKAELKLFSLIKLKMSNKEISVIQNISLTSVYQARYRLRKKLGLETDSDLDNYLMKF